MKCEMGEVWKETDLCLCQIPSRNSTEQTVENCDKCDPFLLLTPDVFEIKSESPLVLSQLYAHELRNN